MGDAIAKVPEITQLSGNHAALDAFGLEDRPQVLPEVSSVMTEQRGPEPERQLGDHLSVRHGLPLPNEGGARLHHTFPVVAAGEGDRIIEPGGSINRRQCNVGPVAEGDFQHVQRAIESGRELDVEGVKAEGDRLVAIGPPTVGVEAIGGENISEGWHARVISLEFLVGLPHNLARNPRLVPALHTSGARFFCTVFSLRPPEHTARRPFLMF